MASLLIPPGVQGRSARLPIRKQASTDPLPSPGFQGAVSTVSHTAQRVKWCIHRGIGIVGLQALVIIVSCSSNIYGVFLRATDPGLSTAPAGTSYLQSNHSGDSEKENSSSALRVSDSQGCLGHPVTATRVTPSLTTQGT